MAEVSKNKLKYLSSLKLKKFRQTYGKFVVEGEKLAAEALDQKEIIVDEVFALESWLDRNRRKLSHIDPDNVFEISERDLAKISNLQTPNQVFLVCNQPERPGIELRKGLSLFLDDMRDPGNVGTILRIADWFAIEQVILSGDSVEIFNPKVVQASMGAIFRVNVQEFDIKTLTAQFPEVEIRAATMDGDDLFKTPVTFPCILVIGNESRGVSPEVLQCAHKSITIPRSVEGKAESLNAAVATGIFCAALLNR